MSANASFVQEVDFLARVEAAERRDNASARPNLDPAPKYSVVGEADLLPAELQTAVATLIATPPSAAAIREVAAAVAAVTGRPEGEGEGAGGARAAPLQLCDTDTMFSLLAGLDIGACLRLAQKSHAACSMSRGSACS